MKVPTLLLEWSLDLELTFSEEFVVKLLIFHSSLCFKMFDVAKNSTYFY